MVSQGGKGRSYGTESDMKEFFMDAHEELIEELMERDPNLTWEQAYDLASDGAYDRMREKMFDAADQMRKRRRNAVP